MKIDSKIGLYEINSQSASTSQNISGKIEDVNIADKKQKESIDSNNQDVET